MKLKDRIERCIEDQFILAGKVYTKSEDFDEIYLNRTFLRSLLTNFYNQEVKKKPRREFLKQLNK